MEAGVAGFLATSEGELALTACDQVCALAQGADAVLIGPGIMQERAAGLLAQGVLERVVGPLFVIDAMVKGLSAAIAGRHD